MAGSTVNLLSTLGQSRFESASARATGRLERRQIAMASEFDAQARIRSTGSLISAQRAALGASGVMGGRTSRLLETQARIRAGREQMQADASRVLQESSSMMNERARRTAARVNTFRAAANLFASGVETYNFMQGLPGDG
ncbi:MAG: hypothetical protein EA406_11825 [Rhodospirillales bacterium]|nr:MAG: hypothetical protein EA406_11825 [Rhodospirillales bacterium]